MRTVFQTLMTKSLLRPTDRLSQTVAALARLLDQVMNDIQTLDSEVQEEVLTAVQQSEAALERQAAERLKVAVEEAQQNTRTLVTDELEARFKKLTRELEQLKSAPTDWETERAGLLADRESANQLLEQATKEHNRALAETDEAAALALELQVANGINRVRAELTARMDAERAALLAERNRAQQRLADLTSDHEGELTGAVNKVRSELIGEIEGLRRELKEARDAAAQAPIPASTPISSAETHVLQKEIARVEDLIRSLSQIVENPATELSVIIRKSAERAELHSYLRGLRFIGQASG